MTGSALRREAAASAIAIDEIDPRARRVAALFAAPRPNGLRLRATLAGVTRGRVVVDDVRRPTQALLRTSYATSFLGGAPTAEFVALAIAHLRPYGNVRLVTSAGDPFATLLPSDHGGEIPRLELGPRDRTVALEPLVRLLPDGHRLEWIDALSLADCHWRREMAKAFGSTARFLRHGVGACVRRDREIVAEAYGMFPTDGAIELAVVTREPHRGRHLATAACAFLLQHLEERDVAAWWSCFEGNVRSLAVARRLGFGAPTPYRVLRYDARPRP